MKPRTIFLVLLVLALMYPISVFLGHVFVTKSDAYRVAIAYLQRDSTLKAQLGQVQEISLDPEDPAEVATSVSKGTYAKYRFTLRADSGTYKVDVALVKRNDEWGVTEAKPVLKVLK